MEALYQRTIIKRPFEFAKQTFPLPHFVLLYELRFPQGDIVPGKDIFTAGLGLYVSRVVEVAETDKVSDTPFPNCFDDKISIGFRARKMSLGQSDNLIVAGQMRRQIVFMKICRKYISTTSMFRQEVGDIDRDALCAAARKFFVQESHAYARNASYRRCYELALNVCHAHRCGYK